MGRVLTQNRDSMTDEEESENPKKYDERDKALFGGSIVGALLIGLILGISLGGTALLGTTQDVTSNPSVEIASAEVQHISNNSAPQESVNVTFDDSTAQIEGVITDGSCDIAELGSVEYNAEDNRAVINVVTNPDPNASICTMELAGVEYEASIEFDGGSPGEVEVRHNGETAGVVRILAETATAAEAGNESEVRPEER